MSQEATMDFIDFEKVSIAEAKAVYKGDEPVKEEVNWEPKRNPKLPSDLKLQNETISWLMSLPENLRPLHLARQFPRIANKLAEAWQRPVNCDKVFDELMIDHRGTRQGFSHEVAKEIADLRGYYNTEVYVQKMDTWTLTL
jgi:hypothetical protein